MAEGEKEKPWPKSADYWMQKESLPIFVIACLAAKVTPHWPITDPEAQRLYDMLAGAIERGELKTAK